MTRPQDGPGPALADLRARFQPVRGKQAEVDKHDWRLFCEWKHDAEHAQEMMRSYEARIREQAGDAQVLTVGGRKVATRVIRKITNASWTEDYFRRTPARGQHSD